MLLLLILLILLLLVPLLDLSALVWFFTGAHQWLLHTEGVIKGSVLALATIAVLLPAIQVLAWHFIKHF